VVLVGCTLTAKARASGKAWLGLSGAELETTAGATGSSAVGSVPDGASNWWVVNTEIRFATLYTEPALELLDLEYWTGVVPGTAGTAAGDTIAADSVDEATVAGAGQAEPVVFDWSRLERLPLASSAAGSRLPRARGAAVLVVGLSIVACLTAKDERDRSGVCATG